MTSGINMSRIFAYGGVLVPYTVSWSAEEGFYLDRCPYAGRTAICQPVKPGEGKPMFGKPHSQRQRETITKELCDLCGKPLRNRTKVSLSHARPRMNANEPWQILQVEPLLHRECAAESMRHCPSLKRDLAAGTIMIRQVLRHDVQFAIMDEIYTKELTGIAQQAIGHAKVHLITWRDHDLEWLEKERA
jgi:hypothetical protein